MLDFDLEVLQRLFLLQQEQVTQLGTLCQHLVQAHFALRERYLRLCDSQQVLVAACIKARQLSTNMFEGQVEKLRYGRLFGKLLQTPRIGCLVAISVDVPTAAKLCTVSMSCRDSLSLCLASVAAQELPEPSEPDKEPLPIPEKLTRIDQRDAHLKGSWKYSAEASSEARLPGCHVEEAIAALACTRLTWPPSRRRLRPLSCKAEKVSRLKWPPPQKKFRRWEEEALPPRHGFRAQAGKLTRSLEASAASGTSAARRLASRESSAPTLQKCALLRIAALLGPRMSQLLEAMSHWAFEALQPLRRIFICGGRGGVSGLRAVEVFDSTGMRWLRAPAMTVGRYNASEVLFGKCVVISGGVSSRQSLSSVERFDPLLNAWRGMPRMALARSMHSSAVLGGHLYVCGGVITPPNRATSSCERFDPLSGAWKCLPPMPTSRACTAVATDGFCLFVGSGTNLARPSRSLECFDPKGGSWEVLPPMPSSRCWTSAAKLCGLWFFCGGVHHVSVALVETYDFQGVRWTRVPQLHEPRFGAATLSTRGRLFIAGGFQVLANVASLTVLKSMESFDLVRGEWELLQPMHCPRAFSMALAHAGHLYVCGGKKGNDSEALDSAERYSLATHEWEELPPMPHGRYYGTVLSCPG